MDTTQLQFGGVLPVAATAALFVIVFAMVLWALSRSPLGGGGLRIVLALSVTVLALYGLEQSQVRGLAVPYAAMAMAMLLSLIAALVIAFLAQFDRWRERRDRRRHEDRARSDE